MLIIPANSAVSGSFDVANSVNCGDTSTRWTGSNKVTSTNQKKGSWNIWLKRTVLGAQGLFKVYDSGNTGTEFGFDSSDQFFMKEFESGSDVFNLKTNAKYRDPNAWMHILLAIDTTQGTQANRIRLYINGVEPSLATSTRPSVNTNLVRFFANGADNSNQQHEMGNNYDGATGHYLLTQILYVDGTQLANTDVGEFDSDSGIWKPIDISGTTLGNNGYYLSMEDSSNFGTATGKSFTAHGFAATDSRTDTCTNNFSTIGILFTPLLPPTYSEGNLQSYSTAGGFYPIPSSIGVANGKWYMELKYTATTANDNTGIGITMDPASGNQINTDQGGYVFGYSAPDGNLFPYQGEPSGSFASYTVGDIMGIYMDLDNMKLYFSKNGALQSATGKTINVSNTGFYYFCVLDYTNTSNYWTWQWNFGGGCPFAISSGNTDANDYGNFEYSPTITGDGASKDFLALCTKNLAESG